jgi:DNA-binding transcriptional LysR family regulator
MPAAPDEILALIAFARVVEAGSFTAAAAKLGVSKSVVSERIAGLEERLGARLLQRTTRKLSLTPEGLALVEPCARLVATADEVAAAADGAGDRPRGLLRVDAPVVLAEDCLAEPIASFLERYPDVRVEVTLNDRFVDLVEEGIDVAVRVASRLAGAGLVSRKLASDQTTLVASPAYLARRGTPREPEDLLRHDCLIYSLLKVAAEWRFRAPGGGRQEITVAVEPRFKASSGAVLREAALAGMGLAVLPTFMIASDLAAGRLIPVVPAFLPVRLGVYAMYPQGRRVPAKTRAFVDHLGSAWKGFPERGRGWRPSHEPSTH